MEAGITGSDSLAFQASPIIIGRMAANHAETLHAKMIGPQARQCGGAGRSENSTSKFCGGRQVPFVHADARSVS